MNLEITELVVAHLQHATDGINARLPGLALKTSDTVPPDLEGFYDEYTDAWILEDKEPPRVPSVAVAAESDPAIDLDHWDADPLLAHAMGLQVMVLYADRDAVGAQSRRTGDYMMRAIRQSLTRLTLRPESERTVRGVCLVKFVRFRQYRVAKGLGRGSLAGLVTADAIVLDTAIR